jgi:hypothetical protein
MSGRRIRGLDFVGSNGEPGDGGTILARKLDLILAVLVDIEDDAESASLHDFVEVIVVD